MRGIYYNYKTTLPNVANAPNVHIIDNLTDNFTVSFYRINNTGIDLICQKKINGGEIAYCESHQWFDNWFITVENGGRLVSVDTFNPTSKVIFIKIDAYALGDNIAWVPYVEEFRKKHNCVVICSTFFNELFKNIYPNILFVAPNTNIDNVYAQYYIGVGNGNKKYSPIITNNNPLQMSASSILGLDFVEIKPPIGKLLTKTKHSKKYICISEYASHENKYWKYNGGWQYVVDFINSIGYDVWVISKEKTKLNNVIDLSGDNFDIIDRVNQLSNSELFIGLSSGLSWLSWSVNTHVIMISDVTPINHEFKTNITRLSANPELNTITYDVKNITTPDVVIDSIKKYIESKNK